MAKRRWTLVFVPPGSGTSRVLEISQTVVKLVAGSVVTVVLLALLFGYSTFTRATNLNAADRLSRENAALISEIDILHTRMALLNDTLSRIARRDEKIRLLANLEPNDPSVQQAGIGGPLMANNARSWRDSLLPNNTARVRVDLNAMIRRANLLAASYEEAADSLALHTERMKAMPSIMPTDGYITSGFAMLRMHPILGVARPHEGMDIMAPKGSPIHAAAGGRVVWAGWESGYGNTVRIDHGFGVVTRYAHASKLLVRKGQRVERGQEIARVGATGLATSPHLHYEVILNGRPVDPQRYILPDAIVD